MREVQSGKGEGAVWDVRKHVYLCKECLFASYLNLSLAPPSNGHILHPKDLASWRALLSSRVLTEVSIPRSLQTMIEQLTQGMPWELAFSLDRGNVLFCWKRQPVSVASF